MATVDRAATQIITVDDLAAIPVENPATGEVISHVPDLSAEQVAELAGRGRAAQPGWQAMGFAGRIQVLRRMQKWLIDNTDRFAQTIISETGKTYEDATVAELGYGATAFGFWAQHAERYLADEHVRSGSVLHLNKRFVVRYEPLGLIGVIGPWNYPFVNSFGDCIPALAAGNSVILKPSELTPLTSLLMRDALLECGLPENVFQVATGRGATGAALVDEADMIMFTGSTVTGRKILERAAQTLTPVSLELGGKDPMIVLCDANLERAANTAVYGAMQNSGQTCISIERVYVEAPVYDEFVAKVTDKVRTLRQGASAGPGVAEIGAMTFERQIETVDDHVTDALAKGARALTGGRRRPGKGMYYEPTVLVDVDHSMRAMTEETFGPTLPIMKVADAEEALRWANDSEFGLSAAVFTRDVTRGQQLARRMEAGAVCVNDAMVNYYALEVPMGGWKASGQGSRHGPGGIRKFAKQQTLMVSRLHPRNDVHMFPYRAAKTRALAALVRFLYGRGKRD